MHQIFDHLKERVKEFLATDGSGHDYRHAIRVFNNACHLQQQEGGDLLIIGAAALVHDICRPREKKTGKSHFGDEALAIISNVLDEVSGLSDEYKEHILHVVALHDMYDRENQIQKTIELQIVQDADNLDAIGALGIGRTFTFGGAYGLPMYDPDISYIHKEFFEEVPGQHTPTTVDHFYEKLLKLSQYMNTSTGKQMAHGRHVYMEQFLDQFFAERNGEK